MTYKIKASFHHVYGYQDSKTSRELTAEKLVSQYQHKLGSYQPITNIYRCPQLY